MFNNQRKSIEMHDMIQKQQTLAQHLALRSGRVNSKVWKKKNEEKSDNKLSTSKAQVAKRSQILLFLSVSCNL
jgi:hypothetical protein